MILQLDCLATDFFHDRAYPTYLYYNPYALRRRFRSTSARRSETSTTQHRMVSWKRTWRVYRASRLLPIQQPWSWWPQPKERLLASETRDLSTGW